MDPTHEFNMVWENDYALYHEVLDMVRPMVERGLTDQTIGRNVKDRVFSWAFGGGWGYADGWGGATSSLRDDDRYPDWIEGPPPAGYRSGPFSYFLERDAYGAVDEEQVGESAREALGLEDGEV